MEHPQDFTNTKCLTSRFSLPLFMVSRNRIKYTKLDELRKHIKKMNHIYDKDKAKDSKNSKFHCQPVTDEKECLLSSKNLQKSKVPMKSSSIELKDSWKLPPNLYDREKIPFANKKGMGGAYWQKEHTHQAKRRPDTRQGTRNVKLHDVPKTAEKKFAPCQRTKGIFLTNARERSATSRCMISTIGTCYKNPSDPGPATYNPTTRTKTIVPKSVAAPSPHLFYPSSIVPVKKNSIHTVHTSFTAAPGRYETRYANTCPCSSKLLYQPAIDLLIDKEKRKKFRRLPYERIKARKYISPDWRHIKGGGHRYRFMGPSGSSGPSAPKPLTDQALKRQKDIQLYPDSKYISMINNPARTPLSLRSSPVLNSTPRIKFNCMAKRVTRKQLKSNKKIAFNSGQERFRDSYRLPLLSQKQQEQLKLTLPLERQFRDHPITNKPLSEIKSNLDQTPKHMLPTYAPKMRKKNFKFQPLPQPKVLVTELDTNVREINKGGYFLNLLEAKQFFKENAKF